MNIYTDLVQNKQFGHSIQSNLLKHSQEYRVLATLRYLFPQKYKNMNTGESPDLQDLESGIGIEVTAAVREDDMKATCAFSKLHRASSNRETEKYKRIIRSCTNSLKSFKQGVKGRNHAHRLSGTSRNFIVFRKTPGIIKPS